MRLSSLLAFAASLVVTVAAPPALAQTRLEMVGFPGASNLPTWVANERGFFAREGLDVRFNPTPGSVAQMQNLMSGKYQLASTSIDNIVAYVEGQGDVNIDGFDLVAVAGVHAGQNSVVTRPEIKSYADIRGKVVAVDALGTGYAFVLFRILDKNGLKFRQDYTVAALGGTVERFQAMKANKAVVAVLSAPSDIEAKNAGFNILADAPGELGGYQGSSYAVRRSWAKQHEAEVVGWVRGLIAAHEWLFENRAGSLELMKKNIKGLSDSDAQIIYSSLTTGAGSFNRRAEINQAGMTTVLSLRGEYAEPKKNLTEPGKYMDLSFYRKAAGAK
jgi:ABC-type nitrate/sulfonate/bicarbonate transport system substrate-binding protein